MINKDYDFNALGYIGHVPILDIEDVEGHAMSMALYGNFYIAQNETKEIKVLRQTLNILLDEVEALREDLWDLREDFYNNNN